jgi:hypothetical protein
MCMARLQAVGQAKPGQSHGLTTALARPENLESQSRRLRPRLSYEFSWGCGGCPNQRKSFSNNLSEHLTILGLVETVTQEGN